MVLLTREQILGADDLKRKVVDVPEWGEGAQVLVRELTAAERLRMYDLYREVTDTGEVTGAGLMIKFFVVAKCAIDEEGNQIFSEDDMEALGRKNQDPIDRISDAARNLSGIGGEDADEEAVDAFDEAQG